MTEPNAIRMNSKSLLLRIVLLSVGIVFFHGCAPDIRYASHHNMAIMQRERGRNNSGQTQGDTGSRDLEYPKLNAESQSRLGKIITSYIGTRYCYGGTSRRGVDCSGFVFLVFNELNNTKLPRSTKVLSTLGSPVKKNEAKTGDLVFFRSGLFNMINHVGIYIGNGRFAHASTTVGVTYSNLDEEYFVRHFAGIRRVF